MWRSIVATVAPRRSALMPLPGSTAKRGPVGTRIPFGRFMPASGAAALLAGRASDCSALGLAPQREQPEVPLKIATQHANGRSAAERARVAPDGRGELFMRRPGLAPWAGKSKPEAFTAAWIYDTLPGRVALRRSRVLNRFSHELHRPATVRVRHR